MSARSYIVQLQAGIGQAMLPDKRKMVPGVQYVISHDVFSKISLGARQNVITVVSVNLDTTTASGSFVPAQASSGINRQVGASGNSFLNLLTTVSPTLTTFSIGGFAAQGASAGGSAGAGAGIGTPQATLSGSANNYSVTGPDDTRYTLIYNGTNTAISGGWATVWEDFNNRYACVAASGGALVVKQDGLGTPYVNSANTTLPGVNGNVTTVGTKVGEFAGVALVNIPAGNFGFVQIEGLCPNVAVVQGTAVGTAVAVSGTSSVGVVGAPTTTTVSVASNGVVTGSALANNVIGTLLTAPASGTGTGQFFGAVELRSRRAKQPYNRFLNKN
jgi:hypothetical protein